MKEIDVVAGVIWRKGKYLGVRRPEGKPFAGYWEFPGGKIDPGETPEQALVRELQEELAIHTTEFEHWQNTTHTYDSLRVHLRFYHVRDFSGEPTPQEGQGLCWLCPHEATTLSFLEADTDIVSELCELHGMDCA